MNAYSGKHVEVKDDWIVVNGEKAFSPVADNAYSQKERLYLTAGKLVKLYHVGHVPDAVLDGNQIYCGDTVIYELSSGENGRAYTNALNQGIRKDRGERVVSDFDIDKRGKKDASDW